MFGLNKAFRISSDEKDGLVFHPINNMDKVVLDDLIGYEIQKRSLLRIRRTLFREERRTMHFSLVTVVQVNPQVSRLLSTSIMTRDFV